MRIQFLTFTAVLLLCVPALLSQDMVEYSTGAARAGATAGAKRASKSIGGVFEKASKTLDKAGKTEATGPAPSSSTPPSVAAVPPARASSTRPKAVDPGQVEIGMERSALLKHFGKPLMKTAKTEGPAFVEVFYYPHPDEDMTVITLREGKVTSVTPAPAEPKTSSSK